MAKGKTFFGRIIAAIGHVFSAIFHLGRQIYDALPPAIKESIFHGSGVVSIIGKFLDNPAGEIREIIADKFPNLPEPALEQALITVLHTLNIAKGVNNLEDALAKVKDYFQTHNGPAFDQVRHNLAVALAHALSPDGTHLATITSTIEAVYHSEHKED